MAFDLARGHDLPDGVAVGRHELEFGKPGEDLVLIAAEDRSHCRRLQGTGPGHLAAADRGEGDRLVGVITPAMAAAASSPTECPATMVSAGRSYCFLTSSSYARSAEATTNGWVFAVSVISSTSAVVPRRSRSSPVSLDQVAS